MYGVRNTKRKLKYQGMGPYQLVEIMPQATVRIATLDGVVMEGYINGSKLSKDLQQSKIVDAALID